MNPFYNQMFNPQYVNATYYAQQEEYIRQIKQDEDVLKAADAARDLCKAVKSMDERHQQQAFLACLAVLAEEFGWRQTM